MDRMEDSGSSDGGSIPPGATKITVFHQAVPYLKQLGKPALLRRAGGDSCRDYAKKNISFINRNILNF